MITGVTPKFNKVSFSPLGSANGSPVDDTQLCGLFTALFAPTDTVSLNSWSLTKDYIVLDILDSLRSRVDVCKKPHLMQGTGERSWDVVTDVLAGSGSSGAGGAVEVASASNSFESISMSAVQTDYCNDLWVTAESFTTPSTLFRVNIGQNLLGGGGSGRRRSGDDGDKPGSDPPALSAENGYGGGDRLKSTPAFFPAADVSVQQHWITSKDGTKVPYFLVGKDLPVEGSSPATTAIRPTLLYGYGGFEISFPPFYGAVTGLAWLDKGGAFALANIRGGGEFGPKWHQAALQAKRPRAYEVR